MSVPVAEASARLHVNMAGLARTVGVFLEPGKPTAEIVPPCEVQIACPPSRVIGFLEDPAHLPLWTCHRTVHQVNGRWFETREVGDIPLNVELSGGRVTFRWTREGRSLSMDIDVVPGPGDSSWVRPVLPQVPAERREALQQLVSAELRLLRALLEERPGHVSGVELEPDRRLVAEAHLQVYRHPGP